MQPTTMDDHHDAVTEDHKHAPRTFGEELWTFEHLGAFARRFGLITPVSGETVNVDVVVLFSNHCFSREVEPGEVIDSDHLVMDGSKCRVLDKARYDLSLRFLPRLVNELQHRHIKIADPTRPNFVTFEVPSETEEADPAVYAVFFEVRKDRARKRRLLMRIQSAYLLEKPSRRLNEAKKIRFQVLLQKTFG